jgi:hypothetical protein
VLRHRFLTRASDHVFSRSISWNGSRVKLSCWDCWGLQMYSYKAKPFGALSLWQSCRR